MKFKNSLVVLSIFVFTIVVYSGLKMKTTRCMGIPFITEQEIQQIAYVPVELENIVCLENHLVPYDADSRTIFLPCAVDNNTKLHELDGQLTSLLPEYDLYFVRQDSFDNLSDAIRRDNAFMLFAIDDNGNFGSYYVNFTTLPVVEMHGEVIDVDEQEREIYSGEITVWDPSYEGTGKLHVQNSNLEWHVRGFSSLSALKKSLKLNLKEKSGNNNHLSLLGFESDDDYILNPMWFDDVKVREKLAMDLWNQMAEEKGSALKMSDGEYCELITNNSYEGLRIMQNKIERSYLKLDSGDILLKGNNVSSTTIKPPELVYEVVFSNQGEEATYQTISNFFYQKDFSSVNLQSWIDLQLLLHLGNMVDNHSYKNIYYVIEKSDGHEALSFIPWDTDMSFGVVWKDDGFRLVPESVEDINYRQEYKALLEEFPELDDMLVRRWKELRYTVFSEANIFAKLSEYYAILDQSGAITRDFYVLGWYSWGEEDTRDRLSEYIQRRLEVLDEYYGMN